MAAAVRNNHHNNRNNNPGVWAAPGQDAAPALTADTRGGETHGQVASSSRDVIQGTSGYEDYTVVRRDCIYLPSCCTDAHWFGEPNV